MNDITDTNNGIRVKGELYTELPEDLFIPPDALRIILEEFEGPLDLLLYLIKKQNIDIVDIPILPITNQYIKYIEMMRQMQFDLASDYLVMAATLAEIKSRMLVPNNDGEEEEDDPRANLIQRLMEYQKYKDLSVKIDEVPRSNRDYFVVSGTYAKLNTEQMLPKIDMSHLHNAFLDVLKRAEINASHIIETEVLSVRERMIEILEKIKEKDMISFYDCFNLKEGRLGVIVTFLAILEMVKENFIDISQNEKFSVIYLKRKSDDAK
tara:strand:+ start:67 stop:864 length:798 start_codon:yes stop_codon:yes gene_type:complete